MSGYLNPYLLDKTNFYLSNILLVASASDVDLSAIIKDIFTSKDNSEDKKITCNKITTLLDWGAGVQHPQLEDAAVFLCLSTQYDAHKRFFDVINTSFSLLSPHKQLQVAVRLAHNTHYDLDHLVGQLETTLAHISDRAFLERVAQNFKNRETKIQSIVPYNQDDIIEARLNRFSEVLQRCILQQQLTWAVEPDNGGKHRVRKKM